MYAEAVKQDIRSIIENKPKFLLVGIQWSQPCWMSCSLSAEVYCSLCEVCCAVTVPPMQDGYCMYALSVCLTQVRSSSGHRHALKGTQVCVRACDVCTCVYVRMYPTTANVFVLIQGDVSCSSLCSCCVEVLADPAISARLADTKAISEVKALDAFYQMLQTEPDRAFYGLVRSGWMDGE